MKRTELILNPVFIAGLVVLILNDHHWKLNYGNFITGKLSDFAGLLILPMFVASLFPWLKKFVCLLVGLLFILWKSPAATPFINLINAVSPLPIHRVIDYSDLLALLVLPIVHLYAHRKPTKKIEFIARWNFKKTFVAVVACLTFMATSIKRTETPRGNIYLGKEYKIKLPKDSILQRIENLGYDYILMRDTLKSKSSDEYNLSKQSYYQISNVVIKEKEVVIDTIKNINFNIKAISETKSKIEVINVELKNPGNIQDWKYLRHMSRFYKNQLKSDLIDEIKK